MSILFEKMTAIADNIRSLLGLTEKLGLDAMTENLETANTEVESQKNIIEQLRSVISEKAGKPLGGSIDDLIEKSIEEVTSNATKIGLDAFAGCYKLKKASFPLATYMSNRSFKSCSALISIDVPIIKNIGQYAFQSCFNLKKAILPLVTKADMYAFDGCWVLEELDFYQLDTLLNYAFQNCKSLKVLLLRSETLCPMQSTTTFNGCHHILGTVDATYNPNGNKDGYIYVPRALVDQYASATNWTTLGADRFRAIEDFSVDGTITGELDESKI